ncbi:hypothetical protein SPI_04003 [Niveomyces insectorum RCEF 264]|uniref:Putative zinc-finger domain-containing protein n=1 Tax=Niveomyces insectorum RCEF 264 TaxID=1081102 RepID=A0A167VCH2_9HYPO|nr:hypothetical protein SPI_04003 [Niveomyces insectorum RCEF 264]
MSGYPYDRGQWPPPQPPSQSLPHVPQHPQMMQYDYHQSNNVPPGYGNLYQYPAAVSHADFPRDPQTQAYLGTSQASHAAFAYNADQVPGLGITVPAQGPRSPNAVGGDLSWSEAFPTAATASAATYNPYVPPTNFEPAPTSYQPNFYQQSQPQQQQVQLLQQRQHYQQNQEHAFGQLHPSHTPTFQSTQHRLQPPSPVIANPTAGTRVQESDLEEGELNEGEREVYDSQDAAVSAGNHGVSSTNALLVPDAPDGSAKQPSVGPLGSISGLPATNSPSRDASVIDLQEDAFYDEDEAAQEPAENKVDSTGAVASDAADADDEDMGFSDSSEQRTTPPTNLQRAVSCSPQDSVCEAKNGNDNTSNNDNNVTGSVTAPADRLNKKEAPPAALGDARLAGANGDLASVKDKQPSTGASDAFPPEKPPFATMDEAKKEAQRAILRLIPYGVNYQTYIEEGFKDDVIKPLFTDLGLNFAPTPKADAPKALLPEPGTKSTPDAAEAGDATQKEERKDRIARLLALKASKPKSALPSAPATQAAAPSTTQAKPEKTKSEKERLLQQKLEALRRTQELRASAAAKVTAEATVLAESIVGRNNEAAGVVEEAATKTVADNPTDRETVPVFPPAAAQLPKRPTRAATEAAATTTTTTSAMLQQADPAPENLVTANELPLRMPQPVHVPQPSSTLAKNGSRKRPVAADLSELSYPGPSNALKRPFSSITRQESSLVIDVSSDDSDEDVEMEVDSQGDETPARPTTAHKSKSFLIGSSALRDFPSLSEMPSSRKLGHSSAMPTPPNGPAGALTKAKDDEYARKLRQIEEMKRKIAEAEAKKARGTPMGSHTPRTEVGTPSENGDAASPAARRAASDGDMSKDDGFAAASAAAAAFLSGTFPAKLPSASDAGSPPDSTHRAKRIRVARQQLPRVEASLQEKMFKLKLFQDKIAALQAEIDAGIAEKQRLTTEMDDLANEPEAPEPPKDDMLAPRVLYPQTPPHTMVVGGAQSVVDVEEVVESSSHESQENEKTPKTSEVGEKSSATDGQAQVERESGGVAAEMAVSDVDEAGEIGSKPGDAESDDANLSAEAEDGGYSDGVESVVAGDPGDNKSSELESGRASEYPSESESEAVVISRSSSPDGPAIDRHGDVVMEDEAEADLTPFIELPRAQPAAKPASTTEAHARAPTSALPPSTFVPYESPLRYFRSYRFHPRYKDDVKGGLRSLTYSGRIQDNVELCPNEAEGQICPDPSCTFQHYESMVLQDDQILVELGRSDDFTGDKKSQFVNGLKDVLKGVRNAKVRDFDTIANEIINFRRVFLGDDSKILSHLEGVTI